MTGINKHEMANRRILRSFITVLARLHGTNIDQVSLDLYSNRSSLGSAIINRKLSFLYKMLPKIAKNLNIQTYKLKATLNGNCTFYSHAKSKYAQRDLKKHNIIRTIRLKRGWTLRQLAQRMNVSLGDVANIESNQNPNLTNVRHVAKALHYSPYKLAKQFGYSMKQAKLVFHSENRNSLASYLKSLRLHHGWKQSDLAKRSGMSQSYLSSLKYRPKPNIDALIKLSEIYSKPLITFLQKIPYYRKIGKHSPAYKYFLLCKRNHISINTINSCVNPRLSPSKLTSNNDSIDSRANTALHRKLSFPLDYFPHVDGKFRRRFKRYCKTHPEMHESQFGFRFAKMCFKHHIAMSSMAKPLGVSRQQVDNWVHGAHMNNGTKQRILELFPNDVTYLRGQLPTTEVSVCIACWLKYHNHQIAVKDPNIQQMMPQTIMKLLYYIQGVYLAEYNSQAFNEPIIKESYGPLIKAVSRVDKLPKVRSDKYIGGIRYMVHRPSLMNVTENVYNLYAIHSPHDLLNRIEVQMPWRHTKYHQPINIELLRRYFFAQY